MAKNKKQQAIRIWSEQTSDQSLAGFLKELIADGRYNIVQVITHSETITGLGNMPTNIHNIPASSVVTSSLSAIVIIKIN